MRLVAGCCCLLEIAAFRVCRHTHSCITACGVQSPGETASRASKQPCKPIRPKAVRGQPFALAHTVMPSHSHAAVVAAAVAAAAAEAHRAALIARSAFQAQAPVSNASCAATADLRTAQASPDRSAFQAQAPVRTAPYAAAADTCAASASPEAGGGAMSTLLEAIGLLGNMHCNCTSTSKIQLLHTMQRVKLIPASVLLMSNEAQVNVWCTFG